MGFFGKKIGKNGKTVAAEAVNDAQRRSFMSHMAIFVTTADGHFHMEPPRDDFDPVTKLANPWELTGSNIQDKLYIYNPVATMDPDTGKTQSLDSGSSFVFRVANDPRNPQNMQGSFCRSSGPIHDVSLSAPAYESQPALSINQQRLNAADPTPGPNHSYCIKTANSTYTVSAEHNYKDDSVNWYLDGGSDKQMFAHVPIENPFVNGQSIVGQDARARFVIKDDPSVAEGYRNRVLSTSTVQNAVDYNSSIGVACDMNTRTEVPYPMDMVTYATKDDKAFIGPKSEYDAMMNTPAFQVENRVMSEISRPGIMVSTASGSQYGFEPTRNPDVWHMIDYGRGGTWDIAPLNQTYETLNAGHRLRGEAPEIIGKGSQVHFEVLVNSPNNANCPFKRGANHTSVARSISQYEPKWMERERMANSGVDGLSGQQTEAGYDFAD